MTKSYRGTYASHGSIKKGNRKSEMLLRYGELLATAATLLQPEKCAYPWTRIDDNWENVLPNQGTSPRRMMHVRFRSKLVQSTTCYPAAPSALRTTTPKCSTLKSARTFTI